MLLNRSVLFSCCPVPAAVKEMDSAGLARAWVGEVQQMPKWTWQRARSSEPCVTHGAGKATSSWPVSAPREMTVPARQRPASLPPSVGATFGTGCLEWDFGLYKRF